MISARPAIPGFGDEFHGPQKRILAHRFEKTTLVIKPVLFAGKNRSKIESKTIDPRLLNPIAETVCDHLNYAGVNKVKGVARSCVIDVVAFFLRQAVVTRVLSNGEEGLGPEVDFYFA